MMNTQSTRDLVKGENALVKEFYPSEKGKKRADFVMMFKCKDANVLTKVFDCILSTREYFKYVNALYWVVNADGDYQALPFHIDVNLSPKEVQPNKQRVYIVQSQNVNDSKANAIGSSHNENLLKSLGKKRQQLDDKALTTLIPQLKDLSVLDKFTPNDCSTVGKFSNVVVDDVKCNVINGKIGDWNVGASVNFLMKYSRDSYDDKRCKNGAPIIKGSCIGKCWGYVKRALKAGRFQTDDSESAYMSVDFLSKNGFRCIRKGRVNGHVGTDYPDKCIGDITVFDHCPRHPHGHIDMWCGKQWVSDFKQRNIIVSKAYDINSCSLYRPQTIVR
jgi:hypothetical protein